MNLQDLEDKINIKIKELENDINRLSYCILGDFVKLIIETNEQFGLTYIKKIQDFPIYYNHDIVKKVLIEIKDKKEFELKIYKDLLENNLSEKEN